ncbi:MAG: hypothetical protein AAGD00_08285 [Planctomycetota bacterium]
MNLVSVIALVLAIAALPAGYIIADGMNKKVVDDAQSSVTQELRSIEGIEVTYQVEATGPDQTGLSVKTTPTKAATERVAALLQEINAQSQVVLERGLEINSAGKSLLIGAEGGPALLPAPPSDSAKIRMTSELVRMWPRVYAELLEENDIRMPPSPAQVRFALEQAQQREVQRLTSQREDQELTEEEQADVTEMLGAQRLEIYRNQARSIDIYGAPSLFESVERLPPETQLSPEQVWEWQMLWWVHQDLIEGLHRATRNEFGGRLSVADGPVKRIERIFVEPWNYSTPADQAREVNARDEVAWNFAGSPTGRLAWPQMPNALYDIRYATIEVLVDATRLPTVLRSIASVNLTSIVEVDIRDADAASLVSDGFFMGGDPVVHATIRVETVWLREWTKQYMPASVRTVLGIAPDPEPEPAPAEDEA